MDLLRGVPALCAGTKEEPLAFHFLVHQFRPFFRRRLNILSFYGGNDDLTDNVADFRNIQNRGIPLRLTNLKGLERTCRPVRMSVLGLEIR